MANITTNHLTFSNKQDFKTITKFMHQYAPNEPYFKVIKNNEKTITLQQIIDNNNQTTIDKSNMIVNNQILYPNTFTDTKQHQELLKNSHQLIKKIKPGQYLQDLKIQNEKNTKFFKLLNEKPDIPEFNFNLLIPQPLDQQINWILTKNGLEQPMNNKNFWFNWRPAHWNTKWNPSDIYYDKDNLQISFDTAWANVGIVLEKLHQKFPNIEMTYEWNDEDDITMIDEESFIEHWHRIEFAKKASPEEIEDFDIQTE